MTSKASASVGDMDKSSDASLLARGTAALRAGDTGLARRLLVDAVRQNPNSETAWLWLAGALKTPQGQAFCLRRALALNPSNQTARQGLERLARIPHAPVLVAQPQAPAPPPAAAVLGTVADPVRSDAGLGVAASVGRPAGTLVRVARYTLVRALVLGLTVVVGVFLAIVLINYGGFVDEIYRDRITMATGLMAVSLRDLSQEERDKILDQTQWEMEEEAGLHEPFLSRCVRWTWQGLTLDWGEASYAIAPGRRDTTVKGLILNRLPNTLLLAGAANLLLFFLALFGALVLARKYGHWLDKVLIALSPISSAPNWVYGIILTVLFAVQLRLLPMGGMYDAMPPKTQIGYVWVVLKHMILPVAAIFLSMFFQSVYTWRTFFLLHAKEDYVEFAEARGLPPRLVERRYILRPTLPFVLTSFALMIITFWQGAMALEIFFGWPGIGALFVQAVWRLARSTVIGLIVIFAYLLALSVFILDILYAIVDPRVRVGGGPRTVGNTFRAAKRPLRLRLPRVPGTRVRPGRAGAPTPEAGALASENPHSAATWRDRLAGLAQGAGALGATLRPALRGIARYPSAIVGLVLIVLLVAVSVYALVTIPYDEAVRLWRENNRKVTYRNPEYAQPAWVNLFRKGDLPLTIILDSQAPQDAIGGTVTKATSAEAEDKKEVALSYVFDYPYAEFPQQLAVYFSAHFEEKKPFLIMTLLTPDGREIEIDSFSITSAHTYSTENDTRLRRRNILEGEGGQPTEVLFGTPAAAVGGGAPPGDDAEAVEPVPLQGTYELRVDGYLFEADADLDAEVVVYGQVHGLAGTDHHRRDLTVALLWGAPVALAFGLLGAVGTSLLSMAIAAVGVWFGGWVDGLVQRVTEINMILPALPLAITIYLVYGKSIWLILGVIVLLSIFGSAIKNYRAMFLQVKDAGYIEAARVYGAGNWRIIFTYLVPRIMPVLVPQLVILIPGFVFLEATLAYLGVSDIYLPTWGKVINDALTNNVFQGHYYWVLEPVALLLLTGLAFALVGFALDRILNPRLREL